MYAYLYIIYICILYIQRGPQKCIFFVSFTIYLLNMQFKFKELEGYFFIILVE